jgi:cytochrome b
MTVWDGVVRLLHWALVASVALASLSTLMWFDAHRPAGYAAVAVVAASRDTSATTRLAPAWWSR